MIYILMMLDDAIEPSNLGSCVHSIIIKVIIQPITNYNLIIIVLRP
jgi:hypothetical protein